MDTSSRTRSRRITHLAAAFLLAAGRLFAEDASLAAAAPSSDRVLFFASALAPTNDPAAEIYVFDGQPRTLKPCPLLPYRGTVVVRLSAKEPFGGYPAYIEVYPGSPHLTFRCAGVWPKNEQKEEDRSQLQYDVKATLRHAPDGNELENVVGKILVTPGSDLHAVWTWSGVRHQLYLNGTLVTTAIAASPFPREISGALRVLSNGPDLVKAPVKEIALYNFAMTPERVAKEYARTNGMPLVEAASLSGLSVAAQWAPGEKKVYVAADAGNALSERAVRYRFEVVDTALKVIATTEAPAQNGFAETLVVAPALAPGKWQARAVPLDTKGKELGSAMSDSWEWPADATWLGNTLGVTDRIQPPWTPIERDGLTLKVWGRDYQFKGGFGLPQQITSQGRAQLAQPVALELVVGGQPLALTKASVTITDHQPHAARWSGTTEAGDVRVRVEGRLEYDGMALLTLRLEPRDPAKPVRLDAVRLQTAMPRDRALFLNTATDQGYWWYSYKAWLPETAGVVHDNLKQRAGKTSFLFFVLMSDHDTGLEWFADSAAGWQVDESKPVQEIIRDANGDVRLQCSLVNRPFELTEPVTITFGYDATPVKPLPPDWRSATVHYAPLKDVQSDLAVWWLWSDSRFDSFRPNVFLLRPNDFEGFAKAREKTFKVKLAPFVNQHVTLPVWPHNQDKDGGWGWFSNLLGAESANDGWTAMPTRGVRDYWAANLDPWIKSGGLDAIYIDEANCSTIHSSLLTGSGYVRPDGTHGFGHNTLGMRDQLKRVRQVFIDNGKRPIVWIPVYGMIIPHAFAFVDVVSEGEAFMFEKPDQPDWIDSWGADLQVRTPGPGAKGGPWLTSLGPAQKFGFMPVFLDYVKFWNHPGYITGLRAQYGLLALLDINPSNVALGWFRKAKQDFGMEHPATAFMPYHRQKEIATGRPDVAVSYYRNAKGILAVITNLGKESFDGKVTLDAKVLGLSGTLTAVRLGAGKEPVFMEKGGWQNLNDTEVRRDAVALESDGSLRLAIPAHDFAMIDIRKGGER